MPTSIKLLFPIATALSLTSCSSIISDLIFGGGKSSKDRRAESYEDRGFSKKKASNLAFEDEVWSNIKPQESHAQQARWHNPDYPE